MANYDWKINTSQWLVPNVWRWNDAFTSHAISSGTTALTFGLVTLQAESGTADDLDSITGGVLGNEIIVTADSGDTITLKHASGTDKIQLASGADLAISAGDYVRLLHNGTQWFEPINSDAGGGGGGGYTFSGAQVYRTGTQTVSGTGWTDVTWQASDIDTSSYWSTGANLALGTEIYEITATIQTAGVGTANYSAAQILWSGAASQINSAYRVGSGMLYLHCYLDATGLSSTTVKLQVQSDDSSYSVVGISRRTQMTIKIV